eukprot:TCONS_00051340-protein
MGQRQFVILYKRYSRKRVAYKKALSNANLKEIEKTKRDLDAYDFFHWFNQHLREYKGRNQITGGEEDGQYRNHGDEDFNQSDDDSTESLTIIHTNHYGNVDPTYLQEEEIFDEKPIQYQNTLDNPSFQHRHSNHNIPSGEQQASSQNSNQHEAVATNFHPTPISVSENLDTSNQTPQQTFSSSSTIKQQRQDPQTERRKTYNNVTSTTAQHDTHPDDIFGQMIASELKTFPDHMKFRVKHELNNVLFKFREQQMAGGQL